MIDYGIGGLNYGGFAKLPKVFKGGCLLHTSISERIQIGLKIWSSLHRTSTL